MKLLFPLTALLLLTACPNNQGQDTKLQSDNNQTKQQNTAPLIEVAPQENKEIQQETNQPEKTNTSDIFDNGFTIDDYPLLIEKISKQEYQSAFDKLTQKQKPTPAVIKDLEQAKTLLQDIVEFDENTETDGIIKSIHFKNGSSIHQPYASFVAYYPDDNILLAEGGHSSDMSFNLNTGKTTEVVGNPNYDGLSSPSGNYKMTAYYGGQECHTHFIQKKVNGEWIKIIELDDIFNYVLKLDYQNSLCFLDDTFFTDDNTLYAIQSQGYPTKVMGYYKITLKSDKAYHQMDFSNIPNQSLPLEVNISFDNNLNKINRKTAKYFSGIYPNAEEIYLLGVVDYQPTIKSLIIAIKENRDILSTKLINIDNKGHIIDVLEIALDGVREHNWAVTSLLTKEQITVTDFHDGDPTQENSYKIDDKGYFYLVNSKDFTNQENQENSDRD